MKIEPPLAGMTKIPLTDAYGNKDTFEGFINFLRWAVHQDKFLKEFQNDKNIPLLMENKNMIKFADWLVEKHWGENND